MDFGCHMRDIKGVRVNEVAKQLVHWFLEGNGKGIQQGMSIWVHSPNPGNMGSCCQAWAARLSPLVLFISINVMQISLNMENYLYRTFGFGCDMKFFTSSQPTGFCCSSLLKL